jgi:hypothetical protein
VTANVGQQSINMLSLVRIVHIRRAVFTVTRTRIRHFASEVPPDDTANLNSDDKPLRPPHGVKIDLETHGLCVLSEV